MKQTLIAAALVLVGSTAAACGGDAPAEATVDEFCTSYNSIFEDMGSMSGATEEELITRIKEWGERLDETGTPEDMPAEARAGFETSVDMIAGLDEQATREDFEKLGEGLSEQEKDDIAAFDGYIKDNCPSPLENLDLPELETPPGSEEPGSEEPGTEGN